MTYILRSRLTIHSCGRGVSMPSSLTNGFVWLIARLNASRQLLRDVVAGSSLSEESDRVGDVSLARRNARCCGLKILSPPSYLVLPDDDTRQYLSTFQPSKQARRAWYHKVSPSSFPHPLIFFKSLTEYLAERIYCARNSTREGKDKMWRPPGCVKIYDLIYEMVQLIRRGVTSPLKPKALKGLSKPLALAEARRINDLSTKPEICTRFTKTIKD